MNIKLVQSGFTKDYKTNLNNLESCLDPTDKHSDIIVFPELAISGYVDDRLQSAHYVQQLLDINEKIAERRSSSKIIVYGNVYYENGQLYNAAFVVGRGLHKVYKKRNLPNYSIFYEDRYFSKGQEKNLIFEYDGYKVGVVICEDLWQTNVVQDYAGVDVLLSLNASPFTVEKDSSRLSMLSTRAQDLQCYLGYTNLVGIKDEVFFEGKTCMLSPEGQIMQHADDYKPTELNLEVHSKSILRRRLSSPTLKYFGDKVSENCDNNAGVTSDNTIVDSDEYSGVDYTSLDTYLSKHNPDYQQIADVLRAGIREYVLKSGLKRVIIPTSGGLDSAAVLALTSDALSGTDVTVTSLFMPSMYNSEETRALVSELLDNINSNDRELKPVKFDEVSINSAIKGFDDIITDLNLNTNPASVADQNLQARIRMCIAMYLANIDNAHVFTGSNKSELLIGYGTLFGDIAGTYAPLKDVYKSMVRIIAQVVYMDVIPEGIVERPPTAELDDDQNDEEDLGLKYTDIDNILQMFYEESYTGEEIAVLLSIDQDKVNKIIELTRNSEFKRYIVNLPGIKIYDKSLTKYDWRQNFV